EGESEEGLAGVLDRVSHPLVAIERVPVADDIARGDGGIVVLRRNLVGSEHLHEHPIIALIRIPRFDNPVTPAPDLRRTGPNVGHRTAAEPIAIAPHVHPVPRPALAVL